MREASPLTEPHYQKTRCEVITTNAALRGPDVLDNGRDTGIQDVRDRYIFD
ncbi:hypothetical protein JSMCR1_p293 (plasmid) [Escherichia coli]|nr:hypothetical protein JSMCR1_p293 [Escherichia coli]